MSPIASLLTSSTSSYWIPLFLKIFHNIYFTITYKEKRVLVYMEHKLKCYIKLPLTLYSASIISTHNATYYLVTVDWVSSNSHDFSLLRILNSSVCNVLMITYVQNYIIVMRMSYIAMEFYSIIFPATINIPFGLIVS